MLKRKALKKIFITTFTVFLLLTIYLIPTKKNKDELLDVGVEFKYQDGDSKNIYLLNAEKQLVRTPIQIQKDNVISQIQSALNNLILSNSNIIPYGLSGILPKNTKLLEIKLDENILYLNFSKEILNIDSKLEEQMIEAIAYTSFEFSEVNGIIIYVDGKSITGSLHISIPDVITRDYGINKEYDVTRLDDIEKVVVYYVDEIEDHYYYVPITKYVNDDRDKIKVIIEELRGSSIYSPNLISYLDKNTELINYEINEDEMILHFNNSIFMNEETILEEVVYSICYSVFDNYDVTSVVFMVDDQEILKKMEKDIE